MKVIEFNIAKGIYISQLSSIETGIHSHPAIEVVFAESGAFTLTANDSNFSDVTFAVIDANVPHQINGSDCLLNIFMIEHKKPLVMEALLQFDIRLNKGIYAKSKGLQFRAIFEKLVQLTSLQGDTSCYDKRVNKAIDYLKNNDLEYHEMVDTIKRVVNLSESRISHLFKENVGVSLKKYLVWCKLKTTIKQHLNQKDDLFTSLIQSGFYDQPHFSKAFKSMLGINPSEVYNSRSLQVLTNLEQ